MRTSQRLGRVFIAWSALLIGLLAWPALASAECESDADCAPGEYCMMTRACPEPADGEESFDCPTSAFCMEEGDFASPMPWPTDDECELDTDCEEGWRCAEIEERFLCLPPWATDCSRDSDCAEGFICFEESAFCAPQWLAPCDEDADCGEGFTCEQQFACECPPSQGGGGAPGASPGGDPGAEPGWSGPDFPSSGASGDAPAPEPAFRGVPKDSSSEDRCTCVPIEEQACELIREACDPEGDDCRAGWSCDLDPSGVVSSCNDAPGWDGSDSVPPPPVDCTDEAEYVCLPDELADVYRLQGGLSGGGNFEDTIGAPGTGRPGGGDAEPALPGEGDDRGGADAPGESSPVEPYPRGNGCSSVPAAPAATPLLLLFGLALLRRRR